MSIPFDVDIVIFSWVTLKVMFSSKARLRRNSRPIPVEYDLEQVPEDQLTPAQKEYLKPVDAQLAAINYRPLCTYRVKNLGTNLLRRYANPTDTASCSLTVVEVKVKVNEKESVRNSSSVEFTTRLSGGKWLTTKNAARKPLFDQPPYLVSKRYPNVTNLADLKRKHDARTRTRGAPCAPPLSVSEVFDEIQEEHKRYSNYQLERGIYHMAPDGASYILSDKVFDRGIRNHFLPFGKRISLPHLLFSALVGAVLPLFGILQVAPWIATGPYHDILGVLRAPWIAIALCYLLAGAIMGFVCDVQKFAWVMLVMYVPAHLVAGWTFGWYPYATIAFNMSYAVAQARRRRALVLQT
jgi:hypothetical protein